MAFEDEIDHEEHRAQSEYIRQEQEAELNSMTEDEFMRKMLEAFPLAQVEQDNDGQLVIYTGLTLTGNYVTKMED